MNLANTIIPRSDQLNSDDLLTGPRTIRITAVEAGSAEQPVNIRYDGDNGRPYKPGKSMRRVLVALYGSEGAAYVGKRVTLYNDPGVTFGPDATGGIRISHASDIGSPLEIALTVKRGKRKPFRVQPLADKPLAVEPELELDAQMLRDMAEARATADEVRELYKQLPTATRAQLSSAEWKAIADAKGGAK
jgi:hypothetical protein